MSKKKNFIIFFLENGDFKKAQEFLVGAFWDSVKEEDKTKPEEDVKSANSVESRRNRALKNSAFAKFYAHQVSFNSC